MPLYFGHKNSKGLSVSPALQNLGIDMLRAAPHQVGAIARPLVVQPGYASYVSHLPAFLKAYNDQRTISIDKQGYPANLPLDHCIPIGNPPLVIDFNGPVPSKHVDDLNKIGFERIKMNRTDNIVHFPSITFEQARIIRNMNPNLTTPAPVNTVNLQSFESWVLVLRVVSNLLRAHTYPAFADDSHQMDDFDTLTEDLLKRKADTTLQNSPKRVRKEAGQETNPEEIDLDMGDVGVDNPEPAEIELRRAKPPSKSQQPWGTPDDIPNTSGYFFPYVPELCSYDTVTVPTLIDDYLIQSLGDKPERQIERMDRIRSAWGLLGKTDAGNVMAHMCKIIHLSLRAQGRTFPIVNEGIYQGCVLSGARMFVGMNGSVYRPLSFDKLQEETGSYHMHSIVLDKIMEIVDDEDMVRPDTMRELRRELLKVNLSEEDRDEIRRLAVHLHFRSDKFLAMNPQTLMSVIHDISSLDDNENLQLPLHHSALFSRDKIFVSLSSFGYQAPSFMIENCPKVSMTQSKPPQTLVIRQKPLQVATVDWKNMLETREMRNNPRNLSRANKDRSIVGNDKTVLWAEVMKMAKDSGGNPDTSTGGVKIEPEPINDGMDDW
jgi:hypothetical protein